MLARLTLLEPHAPITHMDLHSLSIYLLIVSTNIVPRQSDPGFWSEPRAGRSKPRDMKFLRVRVPHGPDSADDRSMEEETVTHLSQTIEE
jgi:hypothetical protein